MLTESYSFAHVPFIGHCMELSPLNYAIRTLPRKTYHNDYIHNHNKISGSGKCENRKYDYVIANKHLSS
jgi:hypothetical protein